MKQFDEFFWNTPLGRYIADADVEMQWQLFQRYLQDFISMSMKVTSDEVLQVGISLICLASGAKC